MVDPGLYPFQSRFAEIGGVRMHYLDEGRKGAETLVMVHGNPTWSFYFRDLIRGLRDEYRIVAPDHIGCGLSEKPGDDRYEYTLSRRVADLEALLDKLELKKDLTLVLHDWGGMIGMAYAARHPERVRRLVILNTACFGLPDGKGLPGSLKLSRTPLGSFLIRGLNAFCRGAARWCAVRRPLRPEVRAGYLSPYGNWDDRIAVLRFVQDIPLGPEDPAFRTVKETEEKLGALAAVPMMICWGGRDFVFDEDFLRGWERRFPNAAVHRFPDAGHYVLEDAGVEILPLVRDFLKSNSLS